jgi:hypothetical protein
MRTNDANTLLQADLRNSGGILASGMQYSGIYYATVVQTDADVVSLSPPPISAGNMTIMIPALSGNYVWGPIPYPGTIAPPDGTTCTVGFSNNNEPIVLGFIGW